MSIECPACGVQNPPGAGFCVACGASLSSGCPQCGAAVPDAARFCPSCGSPVQSEAPPEERKLVTVLFVDLVDSTAMGERLDPDRLRSILQSYFTLVSSSVQAWGGTVEKYIGDAVVAVFGVPRVREDDPARALSAAAEVMSRFKDLAADAAQARGLTLAIRIGVNTGEVIAPSEVRPDRPVVTGDPVNVAARLQSAAEPGGVLVGARTFSATRSLFTFGEAVELDLKGKSQPITAHRLLGRVEGAVEAGPSRNLQARVVGRDRELAALGGLLDDAIETETPHLAILYGPAGIGKSRLAREAVTIAAAERPDLVVLRGRCPAVGSAVTYWPLAEIVRSAAGISLDDSRPEAARKLHQRAGDLLARGGASAPDAEAVIFALATTAGIELDDNPLDRVRPIAVVTELARRWPQFLSAIAAQEPVVVLIEDLHWASEQVVDMVERLQARCVGPILLLATARPEFAETQPSFAAGRAESLALRPLKRSESERLLDGLLPGHDLLPGILEQIVATAEGNPLFVEEIVSRLIEAGSVERDDRGWRSAGAGGTITIPDTIQSLLAARIDALADAERRVLQEAAVVGRVFWEEPVSAALNTREIAGPMSELERRGLVSMRPTSSLAGQVEYIFKHATIRDVAYGGLTVARRARAHAAVGAWLAELSPERPEELAGLVAFHYRAALDGADVAWEAESAELVDLRRRARVAFLIAGATHRKRFAVDAAVELHRLALDLSIDEDQRAAALEELGDDYDAGYDGDLAVPAWDEAISLRSRNPEGRRFIAPMAMKAARMGAVRWGGFSVPMEPEVIDRYVDTGLAAVDDDETRGWLLAMRAAAGLRWMAFHRPDPVPLEERIRAGEEGRALGMQIGDAALEANALRSMGALLLGGGEVARSLELTRPLLDIVPGIDDPRERHLTTIEAAQTLMWIGGEAESLVGTLRSALDLGRELRVHDHCHSTAVLISALYLSGHWDEIPGLVEEHVRTFNTDEAGTTCPFALGVFQLGPTVLAHRGEVDRARTLAASMPKSEAPIGSVEALQAVAANALGDHATARSIAERVIEAGARNFAEEPPIEILALLDALVGLEDWDALRSFLPEARRRSAELAMAAPAIDRAEGLASAAAGDAARAAELLRRAIDGFDLVSPFEAARTREALAALNPEHRDQLRSAALTTYERLGAVPHAARVRSAAAS